MRGDTSILPAGIRSVMARCVGIALAALLLVACDKCGNNIFRVDAGMLVCKDERPKP